MDTKSLAAQLTGQQYPPRVPKELAAQARQLGLVIVYGLSDDLMEFAGAIDDELGVCDGGEAFIDGQGLIPSFESVDKSDINALRDYFRREAEVSVIQALWCSEEGYSWTYKTDIPHETFEVVEDGAPYCRGIVFSLNDLTSKRAGA